MAKSMVRLDGGQLVFGEAVSRIAESLNPLGVAGRVIAETYALTTEMRRINLEGRQAEADKEVRLAQLERRRAESSETLRQLHAKIGNAEDLAKAMRKSMVNMQREVVKPAITLEERKLYADLTKYFVSQAVQHHAVGGDTLVAGIGEILNGAGAVSAIQPSARVVRPPQRTRGSRDGQRRR